jgi:hypothetical protein
MRRILTVLAAASSLLLFAGPAFAGSPHFVDGTVVASRAGDTLTVAGKVAGLGDEAQINVAVTATAACLNPGENFPQAGNKETVSAAGVFPAQNGKAYFSLDLTAVFQPRCAPPMTVVYGDVTVVADGIPPLVLPGTF